MNIKGKLIFKMKIVRERLYEDFVGLFTTPYDNDYEIYKNPKSIKNMGGWCRSVSDENGDLYVGTPSEIIHVYILEDIGIKKAEVFDYLTAIAWQQFQNTNKFYLGESYTEDFFDGGDWYDGNFKFKQIMPAYEAVKRKNPQYEFILQSINNT